MKGYSVRRFPVPLICLIAAGLAGAIALRASSSTPFRARPVECPRCTSVLEPSGIAFFRGAPVFASDNDDPVLYRLEEKDGIAVAEPFIKITFPADIRRLKRHALDIEGLAADGPLLYAVDERDRLVYRIDTEGAAIVVPHDVMDYNRRSGIEFSRKANAGFEGIAVDTRKRIVYIANERDDAIVYTLGLSADGLRLRAMAHLSMSGLTGDDRFDISDLYFENGFLYVLYRRAARILKLDPGSRRIVGSFDAGFAVAGLYHSPEGYGFAEGLYMTRREIFLLLDGGGKAMSGKRGGENGALVVLVRPREF